MRLIKRIDNFIAGFGLNTDGLAQLGHVAVPYGLVLTSYVVGWVCGVWWAGLITSGIVLAFALYKELYRDTLPPENAPFLWNGAQDLAFYLLGIGLATYVASAVGMAFPR